MTGPAPRLRPGTLPELAEALATLPALPPVERARLAPLLIDDAKRLLALARGEAVAAARAEGRSTVALARELGVSRSKLDDLLAGWRRHVAAGGDGAGER